jgi:hypothetical protein
MTDLIKLSDFTCRDDRTLLVGCDFDDTFWLHVFILEGELHFLTYQNEDGEVSIESDVVAKEAPAEDFVTWANFAETIDLELKGLLEQRGVKFTVEWDSDYSFESDEDGYLAPITNDLD